jgi:hypothetical protein
MLMYEEIKVGDKVNTGSWTDRYPGTVIAVRKNGKEIEVQKDDYIYDKSCGKPVMGHQNWIIKRNTNGPSLTYTWRKSKGQDKGYWPKGASVSMGKGHVSKGWRHYYDWGF